MVEVVVVKMMQGGENVRSWQEPLSFTVNIKKRSSFFYGEHQEAQTQPPDELHC